MFAEAFSLLAPLDDAVAAWLRLHAQPGLTLAMTWVSRIHGPRVMAGAAGAIALLLWWRRERLGLWLLVFGVLGGVAVNTLLKHAIARPRPGAIAAATSDYAFPSGHVAWATLLYGLLATLVLLRTRRRAAHAAAVASAAALVALVALSRLVLNAHHASDVVAAALGGVAWLAAWTWLLRRTLPHNHRNTPTPP